MSDQVNQSTDLTTMSFISGEQFIERIILVHFVSGYFVLSALFQISFRCCDMLRFHNDSSPFHERFWGSQRSSPFRSPNWLQLGPYLVPRVVVVVRLAPPDGPFGPGTEVNLFGKSLPQRARSLISLAHPDDRDDLERHAHERFGKAFPK